MKVGAQVRMPKGPQKLGVQAKYVRAWRIGLYVLSGAIGLALGFLVARFNSGSFADMLKIIFLFGLPLAILLTFFEYRYVRPNIPSSLTVG